MISRELNLRIRKLKLPLIGLMLILSIVSMAMLSDTRRTELRTNRAAFAIKSEPVTPCLSEPETSMGLKRLASGKSPQIDQARDVFMSKSRQSSVCRHETVAALMKAMDKPNLNFDRDTKSYYLWLHGGALLGELQAVEAIDLLISHLTLSIGFYSSSRNDQPALRALIKMGRLAIPKLTEVLQHSPDSKKRYSAIYCIATIGGESAITSLRESLVSQPDECAKHLIRVSLDNFDEKGNIKNRMEWFSGFNCNQ